MAGLKDLFGLSQAKTAEKPMDLTQAPYPNLATEVVRERVRELDALEKGRRR